MMEVADTLRESFLFGDFSSDELRRIAQICTRKKLGKGEFVFREGDSGDTLSFVEKGNIRIFRMITDTYDETLAVLGPGGIFGEVAFIDQVSRSTSAVAMETSWLVQLSRSDFDVILSKMPALGTRVLRQIAFVIGTRIRAMSDKISEATHWIDEIREWSEWSLEGSAKKGHGVQIAIKGHGEFSGKVVDVTQSPAGIALLWEDQEGHVNWTPYRALHFMRVRP
jgi:signal-transduction protein with cAMP-binding, CBS, and nucleotidyltransferase domain